MVYGLGDVPSLRREDDHWMQNNAHWQRGNHNIFAPDAGEGDKVEINKD